MKTQTCFLKTRNRKMWEQFSCRSLQTQLESEIDLDLYM